MKSLEVNDKTHSIREENLWNREKLFVNGEFQEEILGLKSESRLYGHVKNENNEIEQIKGSLGASIFSVQCRIFVNDKLICSSEQKVV